MKKITAILLCYIFCFSITTSFAQNEARQQYMQFIKKADDFYEAKDYKNSALSYSEAFKVGNGVSRILDHYNAACSWALANMTDSAFVQLDMIVSVNKFEDYDQVADDQDLKSLHADARWIPLLEAIKGNKKK